MKQRIVCAAVRIDGYVILGPRHWDLTMRQAYFNNTQLTGKPIGSTEEQGFIDQTGQFFTREEAWKIANDANQIIRRVGGDEKRLFSENLY